MKSRKTLASLAISALALGTGADRIARAAAPTAGIVGQIQSSVPDCPNLIWRLARHDDGRITGIFYYSDLSGTSEAVGAEDKDGRFRIQLTSAMGKGPVGIITGQRAPNGKVVADLKGDGCANNHYMNSTFVPNVTSWGFGGNGGG